MINNENVKHLTKVTYQTHGTCSKYICISVYENGVVQDAQFIGGCDGNTKGVCSLIRGMKAQEVIARLEGYYLRQQTNKLSAPVGNCTSGNGVLNVKDSITGRFPVEII